VSVGPLEIIIVLVLALLVFGPKGLPQAGRSLGQAMREFRKATQTARTELGLDELTAGINDLKSSASVDLGLKDVDLGLKDIKSSMTVDLKAPAVPTPRQVGAATAAAVDAPVADKPVPVAAASSDTAPAGAIAAEAAAEPAIAEPPAAEAAVEPVVEELPAVEPAGADTAATGASAGHDDA